jgi:hypothetical protein
MFDIREASLPVSRTKIERIFDPICVTSLLQSPDGLFQSVIGRPDDPLRLAAKSLRFSSEDLDSLKQDAPLLMLVGTPLCDDARAVGVTFPIHGRTFRGKHGEG